MRIDKLLWFLRLVKTRPLAQAMATGGHIRVNGRRVERSHHKISVGDVLTLPSPGGARVIQIAHLPERRGPATEAQSCYRVLDEMRGYLIAAAERNDADEGNLRP